MEVRRFFSGGTKIGVNCSFVGREREKGDGHGRRGVGRKRPKSSIWVGKGLRAEEGSVTTYLPKEEKKKESIKLNKYRAGGKKKKDFSWGLT